MYTYEYITKIFSFSFISNFKFYNEFCEYREQSMHNYLSKPNDFCVAKVIITFEITEGLEDYPYKYTNSWGDFQI